MNLFRLKKFLLNGSYIQMKHQESKLKVLWAAIRDEQDRLNRRRMIWHKLGVVGEFVRTNQYKYNQIELNEMLHDLGILIVIASIDNTKLTDSEISELDKLERPSQQYVKYFPNKNVRIESLLDADLNGTSLTEKVTLWKNTYTVTTELKLQWKELRKKAIRSEVLLRERKIDFEFGRIALLDLPKRYCPEDIFKLFGAKTLLRCAKVSTEKLTEISARGYLNIKEIDNFRVITDVLRKYVLITLDKAKNKNKWWVDRANQLSLLSQLSERHLIDHDKHVKFDEY